MVYVFPAPVCPYASRAVEMPDSVPSARSRTAVANTASCELDDSTPLTPKRNVSAVLSMVTLGAVTPRGGAAARRGLRISSTASRSSRCNSSLRSPAGTGFNRTKTCTAADIFAIFTKVRSWGLKLRHNSCTHPQSCNGA